MDPRSRPVQKGVERAGAIPNAFRSLGFRVEAQADHFAADVDDVTILRSCESRGWIYVAQDLAVRHNPAELEALQQAKIHAIENLKASHRLLVELIVNSTEPMHLVVLGWSGGTARRNGPLINAS